MGKISPEEKIQWVEKIIQNKESIRSVASKTGVHHSSIDNWVRNYKSIGREAFFRKGWTKRSSAEKEAAVVDYLAGKGSLRDICAKYKITDTYQLRRWIKQYNGHEELKDSGGTLIMTKGRKTTFNERVEIVQYCIAHDHNYAETAAKFGVSYQQARSYTVKYEAGGVDVLQDRRDRSKPVEEMSELERLRAENKILRAEKERAEMEVSFLKKLDELERRRG